nr:uncharacterized protein LOC116815297 [Chelonoidis abingdonii]XP_032619416.1 uncharacterized protein LOC116815297 [Chelonoidis abingdonii]XP_032619417.1 uncharacterized protein LOC116815297 [Chelonoidis abingdonii]
MESPCSFPPPLSRGSGAIVESSLLHPLLLIKDVKEQLNTHIRKKRLQLLWGLPYIILNSLAASIPSIPEFLECTALLESKDYQRPLFRAERRKHLERHLREKMVHRKWGLPKRIQKSLKWFIPPEAAKQEPMLDEKVSISTSTHTGLCEASCGSSETCTSRICLTAQRSEGSGQTTVTLGTTSETTLAGSMRNLQRCQTRTCPQNKTGEESLLLEWSMNCNPDTTELPVIGEKKKHLEFQGGKENCDLSEDTEGSRDTFLLGTSPPSTQPALLNGAQSEIGTSFMNTRFRNSKGQCNQNLELGTKLEMEWGVSYMFQESCPAMRPLPAQLTYWERKPSSGAEKSPVSRISGSQKLPNTCQWGFSQGLLRAINPPEQSQSQLLSQGREEVPKSNFVQEGQKFLGIAGSCRSVIRHRTEHDAAEPSRALLLPGQLASLEGENQETGPMVALTELSLESQFQPSLAGVPWALNGDMLRNKNLQIKLGLQSPSLVPMTLSTNLAASLHIPGVEGEESLVTDDTKKYFEFHLREKLLHQKWGLPKRLQESMTLFLLLEATIN